MTTTVLHERSAGVIPFFRAAGQPTLYLVIHSATVRNPHARWEFPKGGIERGEGPRETAAREFEEETGISAWAFRGSFERRISYTYVRDGRRRSKGVTYFLAEVFDPTTMTRSHEHSEDGSGRWYLWGGFEETTRMLAHAKSRDLLAEADLWLRHDRTGRAIGSCGRGAGSERDLAMVRPRLIEGPPSPSFESHR
jgi:bis(5'-nucleosidyl)-tetraphosphatase